MPSPTPVRRKRRSGIVVPHLPRWHQRLLAWLVFGLIQTVSATLRFRWDDRSDFFVEGQKPRPAIYCVWHNRLVLSMIAYYAYAKKRSPTPGMAALVSASRDGGLLSAILECFQVQPVRGSSSRRGPQAMLELTTWAERGYDLAITPDGPRGPRYQVQDGVMSLAQVTGLPIIPVSYYISPKVRFNTWDRFQIPLPFARCHLVIAKPVRVPRESSDAEREELRQKLETTLRGLAKD